MKSYSQFLSEADNQIALLSTELLYTIVLDEANSEEVIIEALNELYIRDELSEEILNEYSMKQAKSDASDTARGFASGISLGAAPYIEGGVKSLAKGTSFKKELKTANAANAAAEKRSPTLYKGAEFASALVPGTGIAKGAAALVKGATAAKAAKSVAAGTVAKSAIDDVSKAGQKLLSAPKSKALVPAANKSVATVPSVASKTGLMSKLAKPAAAATIGALALSGSTKAKSDSQKQVLAKSTSSNTVTRSAKPVDTSAKSSPRPATSKSTTPIIPKSVPKVTKAPEKDPNIGRGFVTAGVSRGPGGNLRTVNLSRGKADTTSMPNKISSTKEPLQKARNLSYAKPADWKPSATVKNLAPQGSAQRDSQLAKMGYKKF
jgi:hypothetical protein